MKEKLEVLLFSVCETTTVSPWEAAAKSTVTTMPAVRVPNEASTSQFRYCSSGWSHRKKLAFEKRKVNWNKLVYLFRSTTIMDNDLYVTYQI